MGKHGGLFSGREIRGKERPEGRGTATATCRPLTGASNDRRSSSLHSPEEELQELVGEGNISRKASSLKSSTNSGWRGAGPLVLRSAEDPALLTSIWAFGLRMPKNGSRRERGNSAEHG